MWIEVYIGKWIIASKFYLSENIIKKFHTMPVPPKPSTIDMSPRKNAYR